MQNAGALAVAALTVIDDHIAVLDNLGFIVLTNKAWDDFASENRLADGTMPRAVGAGSNYLEACLSTTADSSDNAVRAHDGIRAVLSGKNRSFSLEYPCHGPDTQRWFRMLVKPLPSTKPRSVLVIHSNITSRMIAVMESHEKQQKLSFALSQLQTMASQIKDAIATEQRIGLSNLLPSQPVTAAHQPRMGSTERLSLLSKREMEILVGIVRGERNATIAARLKLSTKSISTYRSRVLEKLGVDNNAQLVALATQAGLLQPN